MNTTEFRVSIERRIAAAETELAALRSTLAFADEEPEAPEPYFECEDYEHDTTCVFRAPYADRPSACVSVNGRAGYVPHSRIPELVKTLAELYISDVPDGYPFVKTHRFEAEDPEYRFRHAGVDSAIDVAHAVYVYAADAYERSGAYVRASAIPDMIASMLTALRYAPKE